MSAEGTPGPAGAVEQQSPPPPSPMISGSGVHPMSGNAGGPSSDPHGDSRYGAPYGGSGPPPPHGSYGGPYSSYPPPPYGSSSMYGGPPPPGYLRGPPPPGGSSYPPPPASPYGGSSSYGGYPGGSLRHPPYPPYPGYDYPPRGPPPSSSYGRTSPVPPPSGRGPSLASQDAPSASLPSGSPPPSVGNDKSSGSPPGTAGLQRSPAASPDNTTAASTLPHLINGKLPNQHEVERLRAVAATEITTDEVKPIQTDFHFFVKDNIKKFRPLAEEEVRKSLNKGADVEEPLDPFLVNSNLNTRLMKAWEALTPEQRDSYMVQEEEDRRRFMEEDEIASRHCATLTARGKNTKTESYSPSPTIFSPRTGSGVATTLQESVKEKDSVRRDVMSDSHSEEKKTDEGDEPVKRPAPIDPEGKEAGSQESPTKRNKHSDEAEVEA